MPGSNSLGFRVVGRWRHPTHAIPVPPLPLPVVAVVSNVKVILIVCRTAISSHCHRRPPLVPAAEVAGQVCKPHEWYRDPERLAHGTKAEGAQKGRGGRGQGGPPSGIGIGALAVGVPCEPRCQDAVVGAQVIVSGVDGRSRCRRCHCCCPCSRLHCCPVSFQLSSLAGGQGPGFSDRKIIPRQTTAGRQRLRQAECGGSGGCAGGGEWRRRVGKGLNVELLRAQCRERCGDFWKCRVIKILLAFFLFWFQK